MWQLHHQLRSQEGGRHPPLQFPSGRVGGRVGRRPGIYYADGVNFILTTIQKAVETRSVHLKRQLLNSYEHIYRGPQESMRSFVNRYQRTERALGTVNIRVQDMYDGEARGARMLERSKLSGEHQRQVLIGAGQSLDFDSIKDVLLFQWPEHKALPPTLGPPRGKGRPAHHNDLLSRPMSLSH